LCINDHEACLLVPTTIDMDLTNHIFSMPAQAELWLIVRGFLTPVTKVFVHYLPFWKIIQEQLHIELAEPPFALKHSEHSIRKMFHTARNGSIQPSVW